MLKQSLSIMTQIILLDSIIRWTSTKTTSVCMVAKLKMLEKLLQPVKL
jgi:hypothetical protein